MANMFSGHSEKRVPGSINECIESDLVTKNLWIWSERLEKWGAVICVVMAIIGIFSIIAEGIETANLIDQLNLDEDVLMAEAAELGIEIKRVPNIVIEGILAWSFYCFLEYCTYHIIALLVGSLASIVQHTKITANLAIFNAVGTKYNPPNEDNIPLVLDSETEESSSDSVEISYVFGSDDLSTEETDNEEIFEEALQNMNQYKNLPILAWITWAAALIFFLFAHIIYGIILGVIAAILTSIIPYSYKTCLRNAGAKEDKIGAYLPEFKILCKAKSKVVTQNKLASVMVALTLIVFGLSLVALDAFAAKIPDRNKSYYEDSYDSGLISKIKEAKDAQNRTVIYDYFNSYNYDSNAY